MGSSKQEGNSEAGAKWFLAATAQYVFRIDGILQHRLPSRRRAFQLRECGKLEYLT